nr:ABC transporter substrate-binding protein [Leucobacter chromiireducens]
MSACAPSTAGPQPGETRIVADALGEAEIPVDPQRIVATDFFSSSVLVDVGVTPVGVMQGIEEPGSRPERYIDALAGVEQVSTYAEINVEKVLDLDPDLIIVDAAFPEPETLDRLAAIAPLFHVDLTGSWSERALSIADAANEREQAETQQRQYEERAAEISAEYRELLDAQPLAIVSLNTNDATWASYAPGGWPTPSWVDIDATFRTPTDGEAKTSDEWAWISDEQLEKLDNAGFIVVLEPDQLQRLTGNRVWESLPAVRTGNVFSGFDAPATSSFLWGLDSLDAITSVLDQVTEG